MSFFLTVYNLCCNSMYRLSLLSKFFDIHLSMGSVGVGVGSQSSSCNRVCREIGSEVYFWNFTIDMNEFFKGRGGFGPLS